MTCVCISKSILEAAAAPSHVSMNASRHAGDKNVTFWLGLHCFVSDMP